MNAPLWDGSHLRTSERREKAHSAKRNLLRTLNAHSLCTPQWVSHTGSPVTVTQEVWLQTVQYQDKDFIFVPFHLGKARAVRASSQYTELRGNAH